MPTTTEDVTEFEFVNILFPTRVYFEGGVRSRVHVVLTRDRLILHEWDGSQIVNTFESRILSVAGHASSRYSIGTDDGLVEIEPTGGCGCGNPLRSFDPAPGMRKVQVPLVS